MELTEFYQRFFWLIWYIFGINLLTFFVYGLDKAKAGGTTRRISERTLLVLALLGGSPAAIIGMLLFRHKTQKLAFQAPFAVIIALQILAIYLFYRFAD